MTPILNNHTLFSKNKKQETARDPKRIGAVSCLHAKQKG